MKILFLGQENSNTRIVRSLIERGCDVSSSDKQLSEPTDNDYDMAVSYGYRHILSHNFINSCNCPILNLHISYLPFNRGAHPNFWSFFDNTSKGVTIHLIDYGIDTGPIIFQKPVTFKHEVTFRQTYKTLCREIEDLFISNLTTIIEKSWVPKFQKGDGSFHKQNELPKGFKGWDANIEDEIKRLKSLV